MSKKIEWIKRGMTANNGLHMQEICDKIEETIEDHNSLKKPETAPENTQLVAVDNTNTQAMLNIGDGLSVENGTLKASGGTGEKKYFHQIACKSSDNLMFYFNVVTTTPKFNNGIDAINEIPDNSYIPCALLLESGELTYLPMIAVKESNDILVNNVNLTTNNVASVSVSGPFELLYDNSIEL